MDEERIKSGIPGLDELIEGGIPRNAIVLVSGAPGSGKSIFSLQFIVEGARRGERGLYVSLEQTEEDIKLQSRRFGWDLDKLIKKGLITLRSYMPAIEVYKTKEEVIRSILPLPIDHPRYVWKRYFDQMIYVELEEEFKQKMYTRFVLDSASTLTLFSNDDYATQKITMFRLIKFIREKKMTALITSELSKDAEWYSRDTVSEFLVDGIIVLRYIEGEEGFRTLYIPKMRNTRQATAAFPMEITSNGIVVDSSIEKKV